MDKKILSIIIIVAIIAIAVFAYRQMGDKLSNQINNEEESQFNGVMENPLENMPETNPFETKVNPMEGYKNPFEE